MKQVFNGLDTRIPRATIQTWMQRGVFVPVESAPHRDPRGCRLDEADLTTLLVLRALSVCGVGHISLAPDRLGFEYAHLTDENMKLLRASQRKWRGIQWYIEFHNYMVHVIIMPGILWTGHWITFIPTALLDDGWWHRMRDIDSPRPLILIRVKAQQGLITEAMKYV